MKWLKFVLAGLAFLLAAGWTYEAISSAWEKRNMPAAPGRLVDIGGYRLHIQDMGTGPATVILESGMTLLSIDWALVQPEIAKFARVCSYDRAGLGWSDESPHPRTAENIVSELRTLLLKAEIPGPYILVGHSMGGIYARLFAARYPDEVAGIVLVDASHEEMEERLPPDPMEINRKKFAFLLPAISKLGIRRLICKFPSVRRIIDGFYVNYPPHLRKLYKRIQFTSKSQDGADRENEMCSLSLQEMKNYPGTLKDIPLTVITAGSLTYFNKEFGYSQEWVDQSYEGWKVLQSELASLSSKHKQVIAAQSDHLIPRRQPEIIVDAVKELVFGPFLN